MGEPQPVAVRLEDSRGHRLGESDVADPTDGRFNQSDGRVGQGGSGARHPTSGIAEAAQPGS
jgi:hypothetical protein